MLLETIDVTCCPGSSQLPSNTGTLELVAQTITSAPRITSMGPLTAVTAMFSTADISLAKLSRFAGVGL